MQLPVGHYGGKKKQFAAVKLNGLVNHASPDEARVPWGLCRAAIHLMLLCYENRQIKTV